ncbi:Uncharacterised protein [Vibrio cholerae]|nr:Uncharacterised protein [Vibrio cholerae]
MLLALAKIGAKACVVEQDKLLAFLDLLTFTDEDLLDQSPFQVLDHLHL